MGLSKDECLYILENRLTNYVKALKFHIGEDVNNYVEDNLDDLIEDYCWSLPNINSEEFVVEISAFTKRDKFKHKLLEALKLNK